MEQGPGCNYNRFSIDHPNPVKAVASGPFSGIITCFSAITPPKGGKHLELRLK